MECVRKISNGTCFRWNGASSVKGKEVLVLGHVGAQGFALLYMFSSSLATIFEWSLRGKIPNEKHGKS
jgi:hypothetical protein